MTPHIDLRSWSDDELDRTLDDLLRLGADAPAGRPPRPAGAHRRRWVAPVAAAAAVAGVLSVAILPWPGGSRVADEARTLSVRAGVADVGGVRFPIPDGWSVAVIAADDDSVTACVAAVPAAPCDGVQVVMAVADGPVLPDSTTDVVFGARCTGGGGGYIMADPDIELGDRPGVHYIGGFCSIDGPQANVWITKQLSLAVSTPPGRWADQGAAVVAGLDLTRWPREPGPELLYPTVATPFPPTT